MGLTSKAFSDIITFSRSSNATRIGPDGKVQYAPHNVLTYSEQFDNAAWTKNAASVSANSLAAPDGTITADKLVENTASDAHYLDIRPSVTAGKSTMSVYVKAAGRTRFQIREGSNGEVASFDLNNLSGNITSIGNGWYRCWLTATPASTTFIYQIRLLNDSGTLVYTGDGSSGLYVWGAQVSLGSIAGDYTPTTSAAVYGPRFDYDPVTLAAKGLLIEEQRTNLITYSEQVDNAAWTKVGLNISANVLAAPDGTTTAEKITESAAGGTHLAYQSLSASATAYTVTVYAKAAERSWMYLRFDTDAPVISTWYNLSAGTVGTVGSGVTASITSVGNGWYRCTYTRTATATTQYAVVGVSNADGTSSYAGDGTSGVYVWGAQLEAGAFATSYIPTVASTVTRSADVASVNTLSPWFNALESTLYLEADTLSTVQPTAYLAAFHDGTSNELFGIPQVNTAVGALVADGGVIVANFNQSSISANTIFKFVATFKLNDIAISLNGASVTSDTSATLPTVTTLTLGARNSSGSPSSCHLRRVAYYPRRLTNAELQALTA